MDQRRDVNPLDSASDPTAIPGEPLVDPLPEPDLSTLGAAPPEASGATDVDVGMAYVGADEVDTFDTGTGDAGTGGGGGGKAAQVKDAATSAAGDAASTAGGEAKRVASEAATQARSVVEEVKGQASGLFDQTRDELRTQADARSANAAGALRTLSERLQALADGRPGEAGPLAGYLDEARGQVSNFASRLDSDGVDGVMSDVTSFARRRPGVFLLAAAGTGFLVGRLVRGARAADDGSTGNAGMQPYGAVGELAPMDPIAAAPTLLAPPVVPATPSTTGVVVP